MLNSSAPPDIDLLVLERHLWDQGIQCVCGIDEAGRGSLVGDVVAAAVIFPPGVRLPGVKDSKALTPTARARLYEAICTAAVAWSVGTADVETVDRMNIKQAARLAMKRAVEALPFSPGYLLIDAESIDSTVPQEPVIRGDARSHTIAAASIVAKVTRDRMCMEWEQRFPGYGFAQNKGYATREHLDALRRLGPCALHRRTFLGNFLVPGEAKAT